MNAAGPLSLLFAGDCNMQDTAEDDTNEGTLHLTDVLKEAGSNEKVGILRTRRITTNTSISTMVNHRDSTGVAMTESIRNHSGALI
jgi:hypothetical protein